MSKIKVISSGSIGNCYVLEVENEKLIIELGVNWGRVLKGINYDLPRVSGCLVSHIHTDHSRSIEKALQFGLDVYSNKEVSENFVGVKRIDTNKKYRIGSFIVQPMHVVHNAENYAYLIEHEEFGRLVFFTDCIDFPYNIKNVDHIVGECNYSEEVSIDKLINGEPIASHSENHCELNECIGAINRLKNPNLKTVMCVHLSDTQSDEKLFGERILESTGFKPIFASKGMEIDLWRDDF